MQARSGPMTIFPGLSNDKQTKARPIVSCYLKLNGKDNNDLEINKKSIIKIPEDLKTASTRKYIM